MKEILVAILILSVSASVATAGNVHPVSSTAFVSPSSSPGNPTFRVPITIHNPTTSETLNNTQVLLKVNWSAYKKYLAGNVSNVRFENLTQGFNYPAWLETNDSNASTSSNVWVNLTISRIPAKGNITIFLVGYNTSTIWGTNWGLAPELTTPYGKYDNGHRVFDLYANFSGTTTPAGWTNSGAYPIDNGVQDPTALGELNYTKELESSTSIVPYIIDMYGNLYNPHCYSSTANYYMNNGWEDNNSENSGLYFQSEQCGGLPPIVWGQSTEPSGAFARTSSMQPKGFNATYTLSLNSSTVAFYLNYSGEQTTPTYAQPLYLGFMAGGPPDATNYFVNWIRLRTMVPDNIMPTSTFGAVRFNASVVSSFTDTSVTLGWTNPSGVVSTNTTVQYGLACGYHMTNVSEGAVVSSATLTLSSNEYCFDIQLWDAGVLVALSGNLSFFLPGASAKYTGNLEVWNNASTASGSFDFLVNVSSGSLTSNASNFAFAYSNYTTVFAWIESNASNSGVNHVWLWLYSIPADSHVNITLDIYPSTVQASRWNGPTGKNPLLTIPYGHEDDGALVFPLYENFTGTTCPSTIDGYTVVTDYVSWSCSNGAFFRSTSSTLAFVYIDYSLLSTRNASVSAYGNFGGIVSDNMIGFVNNTTASSGTHLQGNAEIYSGYTIVNVSGSQLNATGLDLSHSIGNASRNGVWTGIQLWDGKSEFFSNEYNRPTYAKADANIGTENIMLNGNDTGTSLPPPTYAVSGPGATIISHPENTTIYWFRMPAIPNSWFSTGGYKPFNYVLTLYLPPVSPTSLSVKRMVTSAILTWGNPSGTLTNDTVYVGTSNGVWTQKISAGVVTSYTVTGLLNGTEYWYSVSAWNSFGDSNLAASINDSQRAPALSIKIVNSSSVSIKFGPVSFAVFNDTVKIRKGCSSLFGSFDSGNNDSYVNVSGLSETSYCVVGSVWSYGGASQFSLPLTFSLASLANNTKAPVLEANQEGTTFISLKWSEIPGAVMNYTIYYGFTCSFGNAISAGNVTTYTVTGLVSGHGYCFAVQGWLDPAPTPLSNTVSTATFSSSNGGIPPSGNATVIHKAGVFISTFGLVIFIVLILLAAVWALVERRRIR